MDHLEKLGPFKKREFLPQVADLQNKEEVIGIYERLLAVPIASAEQLIQWLHYRSELEAALDQKGSILQIKMTCQTDHRPYADDYRNFVERVLPEVSRFKHLLDRKYWEAGRRFSLSSSSLAVYERNVGADIRIFKEENIPLETELRLLAQEYQTLCAAITVELDGKEYTPPEMSKFFQEPDRALREKAWLALAQRRKQNAPAFEALFDKMVRLRHQSGVQAGFANFRDYQFQAYHRFDYSPEDCKKYVSTVEHLVLPVYRKIMDRRKGQMKLNGLRPWDGQVDSLGRPPLKPFQSVQELVSGVRSIVGHLDPEWENQFREELMGNSLLDLESRKGKAPGGYQTMLAETRKPFIFMNAVGIDDDVKTLLHESGHAFHSLACCREWLYDYRHAPMEFCEVASMSMELLGAEYLGVFYGPEDAARSRQNLFESIIHLLLWVALIDGFQHWIYEHPGHSSQERTRQWLSFYGRLGGDVFDWSGLEEYEEIVWHRVLHIFEVPFYYIEYGIAQLGALQVWLHYRQNPVQALSAFQAALEKGWRCPLPDLFQTAGLSFDFSEKTIEPLVAEIKKELRLE